MKQLLKFSLLLLVAFDKLHATPLKLHFPDDISWKSIFDRGFRPKHVSGLERKMAECIDQEVDLLYGENPSFRLDTGLVTFQLQSDDSLYYIEYVSRVPITMEEGERRLNSFNDMFSDCLIRRGTMPPLVDPRFGSVMTVGEFAAVARKDRYTIHYRFNGAMNAKTPLLPVLLISFKLDIKHPMPPIRRKIVEPPPGYEWYSMDPKVHTPDPGSEATAISPAAPNPPRNINGMSPEDYSAKTGLNVKRTLLSIATAAACLVALLVWVVWRFFTKSSSKPTE